VRPRVRPIAFSPTMRQKGTATMADQPWFKFYAADYLLDPDVDAMPREAEALLVRMWCICHREGSCPTDVGTLARKTQCSEQYVSQFKPLCEPFFELQGGKLYSRRMEEEKLRSEQARKNANKRYTPKSKPKSESESESESERGSANCTAIGTANRTANGTAAQRPTLEQIQGYCQERKNHVNPQQWFDHYASNGWKVGRNPMKDWKAAVRTWERNGVNGNGNGNRAQQRQSDNLAALAEVKRDFGLVS
jgi:uncharacterized protein YdaU (DUF1376 family)